MIACPRLEGWEVGAKGILLKAHQKWLGQRPWVEGSVVTEMMMGCAKEFVVTPGVLVEACTLL